MPLVDELGALEKEMAPHAQKLARIEALRKALRAACPVADAEPWSVTAKKFCVILGPKALERSIDFGELVKKIGAKAFAAFAKTTLKDLEAHVAPDVVASVVKSLNTGSRSLKTFERAA